MDKNIRRFPAAADMTSTVPDTATVTHIRSRAAARARSGAVQVILGARAARADQALRAAGHRPASSFASRAAALTALGAPAAPAAPAVPAVHAAPLAPSDTDGTAYGVVEQVRPYAEGGVAAGERCAHGLTGQSVDPAYGA
ncbi:hypothetical protein [Streptomyces sp. DSM 15324]|uniref:hypothetical protein n=1 Tax=Streptomyces sp. DSM 15324 TaxID=1739111 RepID=UPI00074ACD30|nr:hypothetical protein [Streptomyces sp. DSM 15324]KUO12014.1 hypothetical protein AQJ58_12775 [Streptomyces sp. DSM 15324]